MECRDLRRSNRSCWMVEWPIHTGCHVQVRLPAIRRLHDFAAQQTQLAGRMRHFVTDQTRNWQTRFRNDDILTSSRLIEKPRQMRLRIMSIYHNHLYQA